MSYPRCLCVKTFYLAANEIHELLISEHQQLIRSQQVWLQDALESTKENTDALLFMLYEAPNFRSELTFGQEKSDKDVWLGLSRIIGYDPNIGFAQAHDPHLNKSVVIAPYAATLYPVDRVNKQDGSVFISLLSDGNKENPKIYTGVPLGSEMQKEQGYTLFVLIEPKKDQEEISAINQQLARLSKEGNFVQSDQLLPGLEHRRQEGIEWGIKINMIRTLAPVYYAGINQARGQEGFLPEGIVRVDASGNGYAILSREVFSFKPLFKDELYYKRHLPPLSAAPLATGAAIIIDAVNSLAYIGNTVLLDKTYFTIGSPLGFLAKELAVSSNRTVLLKVNNTFWIGYDGQGNKISRNTLEQFVKADGLEQKSGIIDINKHSYFYSQVSSLENDQLVFYDFHPMSGSQSIVTTLLSLEDKLSNRISTQLSLISLGTMLLVLLFIGRIGYTVIYPVSKLAAATQDVVAGKYHEVILPDVGERQDEVAILTRSFRDMVKGLQERENIRAVLDKVVSKDVADEILRTHIHLGGEDRVISMLFCDIRDFSTITAHMPPQKTIEILNVCMTLVSRVIEGEGGVIDKYVGDEVMAIFGAPTAHPDHALRAVSTGMLIVETLKKWNAHRAAKGEPVLEMGIGIHTGLVVAGNMGAEDRLNYTVLGANVNSLPQGYVRLLKQTN